MPERDSFSGVNDELQFAHYLYHFKNTRNAKEQAQHFVDSAKSEKAKPLMLELSLDTLLAKDDSGTTIRVTDPETGGYYYWYVATRGRDLSLLMIGGAPNAQTLTQFNQYKNIVSHRYLEMPAKACWKILSTRFFCCSKNGRIQTAASECLSTETLLEEHRCQN